jgi:predicted Fe-S protein YdhL (DUF1289 family)
MNLKNFDPAQHDGPLPSPCISLCEMHRDTGLCKGCRRSIDEIMDWSVASETQKLQIWTAIRLRRALP